MIFLLACLLYVVYILSLPVRLHYREQWSKHPGALAWNGFKTLAVLGILLLSFLFFAEVGGNLLNL